MEIVSPVACPDTAKAAGNRNAGDTFHDQALIELGFALKALGYQFTTVTPLTHARINARRGNEWAASLEGVLGWSRPFHADVISHELFALMRKANILVPHEEGWRSILRASTLHDALFFHSAYPTTDASAVFFGPDTYRFVDAINHCLGHRTSPVRRAVDIGCGAGPGAISIAHRYPQAEVFAVDINDLALRLAAVNAALAGADKLTPVHSDLLGQVEGSFDLIVANPPYLVDPAERAYRHGGGALGTGLSLQIIDAAIERLRPGGTLLLYTGVPIVEGRDNFRLAAEAKLRAANFACQYREIDPDVFGEELENDAYAATDRIAAVVLIAQS